MDRLALRLTTFALGLAVSLSGALAADDTPAAAVDWTKSKPLTVQLSSYAFNPEELDLKSGVVYRIHFVDVSGKSHNFSAPKFFAASTIAPQDKAKIDDGAVDLDEGASTDITLEPLKPGTYPVECTHFLHAMFGMTGKIVVQ